MRLGLIVGAVVLLAGAADAKIIPVGHKKAAPGDERMCTTVTTVVKRGATVLSTTSTTRCEDDKAQPAVEAATASAPGAVAAGSPPPAGNDFPGGHGLVGSLFSLGTAGLKPRDVAGEWSVFATDGRYVCKVRLSREATARGYRVINAGCRGAVKQAAAWRFEQTEAGLYTASGSSLMKLTGDHQRLSGETSQGERISLVR